MELLQEEEISREEKELYLEALCASETRIRFLTEGFIKMSRLENHRADKKRTGRFDSYALNSLLQMRKDAQEKQIVFSVQGEEELCVSHDAKWLGEAVYNLLDNSVKYSQNGSKIEIKISKNEMFAQITVRDFGVGIEHEELNLIFQRFYRGKRAENYSGFVLANILPENCFTAWRFYESKEKEKRFGKSPYFYRFKFF